MLVRVVILSRSGVTSGDGWSANIATSISGKHSCATVVATVYVGGMGGREGGAHGMDDRAKHDGGRAVGGARVHVLGW